MQKCSLLFILLFLSLSLPLSSARAWTEKGLDSTDPFVFTPNNLNSKFYYLETSIPASWVAGSFEWVRVDHRLLVPRAKVKLKLAAGTIVHYQGRALSSTSDSVEFLVMLTQEKGNVIEVNGQKIPIRFRVPEELKPALILDNSCSTTPIQLKDISLKHSWAFVYCHSVHTRSSQGISTQVDVQILWEHEQANVETYLNSNVLPSSDGITHELSFNSSSAPLLLKKGEDSFRIEPSVPAKFQSLSVSMGLGPYFNQNTLRPFATIYAAYYFNEQMKLASFTALPLRSNPEIDMGLYMISEQFRGLDERVIVNFLLGGHTLYFSSQGTQYFKFSVPQGIELTFKDLWARTKNGSFGLFFYPEIAGRSYFNTWVRYGSGKFFWELNYISWLETINTGTFSSKSFGLSVGFPLFKAL